jgi:hypothetical protein
MENLIEAIAQQTDMDRAEVARLIEDAQQTTESE